MKTIRIPTSITDIKILLLEKFDKDFQVKVNSYYELQRSIKAELERAKTFPEKKYTKLLILTFPLNFRTTEIEF